MKRDKKYLKALGSFAKDIAVRKAALSESSGATGGYLLPTELTVGVDAALEEFGLFFSRAFIVPMTSAEVRVPVLDLTKAHSTDFSPLLAGMEFNWTQEGTSITESEPSFSEVILRAWTLSALAYVSNQLVQDGGEALGAYLDVKFTQALLWVIEREFFRGSGVGKPVGIVDCSATRTVARNAANDVRQTDLAAMAEALLPASYPRAVWACCPSAFRKISELSAFWVNAGQDTGNDRLGLRGVLYGAPLFVSEKLPDLGSQGDVVLFDPLLYVVGKRDMELAFSMHNRFDRNQCVYRISWRGDGRPAVKGTFTLADGSTASGCFVALL